MPLVEQELFTLPEYLNSSLVFTLFLNILHHYGIFSSTTKTSRHDIAEILLKLALKHQTSINQSNITVCLYMHTSKDVPCKGIGAWLKTQIVRLAST
jgi:hypothetical protein